ncbi:MAG TPA: ABC transporter ATP-binding protein [Bacteroidales bacterium]|nr:ABC transporter ATP-binding protein [Bacteroidales bacterium]
MTSSYIECKGLNKQYTTKNQVIDALTGVNLNVERGQIVLLKGRSGAGKSTLLHIIGGLIKPTSGTVKVDNEILNILDNQSISRLLLNKIGIVFQSLNLLPTYSIYENIEIALAPKGYDKKKVRDLVMPYFGEFRLADKMHLLPEELSLGQQQRVAIIRTLVKDPSLILADEPTASVDEQTAQEILDHLSNLRNKKNVTVIIATHGLIPGSIADATISIEDGRIK